MKNEQTVEDRVNELRDSMEQCITMRLSQRPGGSQLLARGMFTTRREWEKIVAEHPARLAALKEKLA